MGHVTQLALNQGTQHAVTASALLFDKVYFRPLLMVRNGNGNLDISEFMAAVVSEAQCSWARCLDLWQFPEMTGYLGAPVL